MNIPASLMMILGAFCLSACNVYQSSGRKSFEAKIPESRQSQRLLQNDLDNELNQETCWLQPSDEPLWRTDLSSQAKIEVIEDNLMQVCISER